MTFAECSRNLVEVYVVIYMLYRKDERKKEGTFLTFNLYFVVRLYHWACNY